MAVTGRIFNVSAVSQSHFLKMDDFLWKPETSVLLASRQVLRKVPYFAARVLLRTSSVTKWWLK